MKRLLIAIAIVLAACSGNEETTATTAPPVVDSTTATSLTPTTSSFPRPDSTATSITSTTTSTPSTTTTISFPTGLEPSRIEIPSIGVDAEVVELSLAGGDPEVPSNFADAGWYTSTRNPGETGPAVIAGHIDSRSGPGVFLRLDELEEGDEILIFSADGESRTFIVVGSGQYPKTDLPREVFGFGDPVPELRLITCGGSFDSSAGHYRDNFVVYAQEN